VYAQARAPVVAPGISNAATAVKSALNASNMKIWSKLVDAVRSTELRRQVIPRPWP
jgi:hypothetical protein